MPAFTSEEYTRSLDAVYERLGVNQEHNEPSTREQKLQEGCVKLGWHVDATPRGVRHCAQGKQCDYCGLGWRVGAKQSVVKTCVWRVRRGAQAMAGRRWEPIVRYKLSDFDAGHLRAGIDGAAQMLEAAGARRIFASHSKWVGYDPGSGSGSREQFMADADSVGYGRASAA